MHRLTISPSGAARWPSDTAYHRAFSYPARNGEKAVLTPVSTSSILGLQHAPRNQPRRCPCHDLRSGLTGRSMQS